MKIKLIICVLLVIEHVGNVLDQAIIIVYNVLKIYFWRRVIVSKSVKMERMLIKILENVKNVTGIVIIQKIFFK